MAKAIEVEIRILLKQRHKIENQLKKLRAKIIYAAKIKDYWFCSKIINNYKQASIDQTGFALRIREVKDQYTNKKIATLECKTLSDGHDHSFCHEHEIFLTDTKTTRKILADIGLKEFLIVDKARIIYHYKNIKFCFDKIKGLGEGLEMEIMAKNDLKLAKDKILALAKKLGIRDEEILPKSLTYLAMEKLAKF